MKVQPVIVISPWVWLLITFWKPLLVTFVVFLVLLFLLLPIATRMAVESAARHDAAVPAVPTLAIRATVQAHP